MGIKGAKYRGARQGLGLQLEDALEFWRKSFKDMTDDKFAKEHAYNIRHNYGKEGKRVNYTPYGYIFSFALTGIMLSDVGVDAPRSFWGTRRVQVIPMVAPLNTFPHKH